MRNGVGKDVNVHSSSCQHGAFASSWCCPCPCPCSSTRPNLLGRRCPRERAWPRARRLGVKYLDEPPRRLVVLERPHVRHVCRHLGVGPRGHENEVVAKAALRTADGGRRGRGGGGGGGNGGGEGMLWGMLVPHGHAHRVLTPTSTSPTPASPTPASHPPFSPRLERVELRGVSHARVGAELLRDELAHLDSLGALRRKEGRRGSSSWWCVCASEAGAEHK
jgi:hypothetical protein